MSTARATAVPVELRQSGAGWQLFRNGEPFFIRGAGGSGSLEMLAAAGANSVRTWSTDDAGACLDAAQALGMTVTVGIWLGHERHGFDYGDEAQVREQFERAREAVLAFRDHPALLLWGLGNEMEGFGDGDDPAVWQAVNDIAAMVKSLDPAHPTMTVTAEIGGARIHSIHERCPAIDIHGVNAYGGAASLLERYRAAGARKPFVLTEFGPPGPWEVATSSWGAPYEPTSTEKAAFYRQSHEQSIAAGAGLALGSYAFLWGHKMEGTATWFGMLLDDGSRLGAVDAMAEIWSGSPAADPAPVVEPLIVQGSARRRPGDVVRVAAPITGSEDTPLRTRWVLRPESDDYTTGGDFRPLLPDIDGAVVESGSKGARVRMPPEPGHYRLFLYAYDVGGNAATANVPLLVVG